MTDSSIGAWLHLDTLPFGAGGTWRCSNPSKGRSLGVEGRCKITQRLPGGARGSIPSFLLRDGVGLEHEPGVLTQSVEADFGPELARDLDLDGVRGKERWRVDCVVRDAV